MKLWKRGLFSIGLAMIFGVSAGGEAVDPYLWLEEVDGEKALAWVEARNSTT